VLDNSANSTQASIANQALNQSNHPMDASAILKSTEEAMSTSVEYMVNEFAGVRTGKASPQLVENMDIKVISYGSNMKLKQLAAISTPDARTIMIQPFDPGTSQDIERGLRESNLGINPAMDGKNIRLPIPELTEERRKDLVKVVRGQGEDAKVIIRGHRRDGMEAIKKLEKEKSITEDDRHMHEDAIQKLTDKFITEIETHLKTKEAEIMRV
jgi:ribosome recycling factor